MSEQERAKGFGSGIEVISGRLMGLQAIVLLLLGMSPEPKELFRKMRELEKQLEADGTAASFLTDTQLQAMLFVLQQGSLAAMFPVEELLKKSAQSLDQPQR